MHNLEHLFLVGEFPERGRTGPAARLRELPVRFGRAAYLVHYRIEPGEVIVVQIFHSRESRRPAKA